MDIFLIAAFAAAIVAFGVGYLLGLAEGKGEADAIAAKVIERMGRR